MPLGRVLKKKVEIGCLLICRPLEASCGRRTAQTLCRGGPCGDLCAFVVPVWCPLLVSGAWVP